MGDAWWFCVCRSVSFLVKTLKGLFFLLMMSSINLIFNHDEDMMVLDSMQLTPPVFVFHKRVGMVRCQHGLLLLPCFLEACSQDPSTYLGRRLHAQKHEAERNTRERDDEHDTSRAEDLVLHRSGDLRNLHERRLRGDALPRQSRGGHRRHRRRDGGSHARQTAFRRTRRARGAGRQGADAR